jgi:hypothetical protein
MSERMPIVGYSHTPLEPLRSSDMHPVPLGVPIADLAPNAQGTLICRVNGEFLSRESWASETRLGDVIEFYECPQDKDVLRLGLSIGAMFLFGPAGALGLGGQLSSTLLILGAQLAINALLPPTGLQAQAGPGETGKAFSANLTGNQARLDQPIWKICGRREITPPFACQPYMQYLPKVGAADPNLDNDQYYYVLLAVGIGDYEVSVKIGNTPISRFADVTRATYLPPGTLPTEVRANVTTAGEVSSQVLDSGRYVGGYAACAPQRTCASIGIDVVATRGLGSGEDARTVSWRVEYRPINDFGQALGAWATLGMPQSRTAYTSTPQRWSVEYVLGTPARVEIRVVRTDVKDTSPSALHEIAWTGLRAYLAEPAPLNPHCAHYEVVMRASDQLSQSASHDIRMIVKGFARTLNADLEWQTAVHTRNGMWWLLDLATSDTWGINKPDDRVDLQSFYDLAQTADERQDRFDWCFDSSMNAWDAMQLIARSCRARVFRRNGVISVARDELADLPVTAFTPRNCSPGMGITETLRQRNSPDGIVAEYQDHRTWEWTEIECPCPGVVSMTNPVIKRFEGITGATHAHREGLYEAAHMLYRPRTVGFKTEQQGMLPAYMSPVDFLADIVGYGHSGDVAFWDAETMVMGLSEPPDWSAGVQYLTLIRDDGTLTDPVRALPGPTEYDVLLPAAPDFTLVLDDGTRERPKYLLGVKDLVKITSIADGGMSDGEPPVQLYAISGLIDDERVHLADVALLPGPGVIQDPTGEPDDEAGGGSALLANIDDITLGNQGSEGVALTYTFYFNNDGSAAHNFHTGGAYGTLAGQWFIGWPYETSETGQFEVRFTLLSGYLMPGSSATGVWLPLDVTRTLTSSNTTDGDPGWLPYATVLAEIRLAAAPDVIQDSATITIICT